MGNRAEKNGRAKRAARRFFSRALFLTKEPGPRLKIAYVRVRVRKKSPVTEAGVDGILPV